MTPVNTTSRYAGMYSLRDALYVTDITNVGIRGATDDSEDCARGAGMSTQPSQWIFGSVATSVITIAT